MSICVLYVVLYKYGHEFSEIYYYLRCMIHRHYNPWHITNTGERAADQQFSMPRGVDDFPVHILYQQRISSRFLEVKMAGDCDFLVFTQHGIMVIEVKGGLIGYGKSDEGLHGNCRLLDGKKKELIQNPFTSGRYYLVRVLPSLSICNSIVEWLMCITR